MFRKWRISEVESMNATASFDFYLSRNDDIGESAKSRLTRVWIALLRSFGNLCCAIALELFQWDAMFGDLDGDHFNLDMMI